MIQVTATEFKSNLGKYLRLVNRDEIQITKNGEAVAILSPTKPRSSWVDDLVGIVPGTDMDAKQLKAERLAHKHENTG